MLSLPRAVHRAVPLRDGSVLLVGGCATRGCGGFAEARTSEVVDPRTGTARPGPAMTEPRASGTATLLPDGRVLMVGGYPGEGGAPTAGTGGVRPGSRHLRAGRARCGSAAPTTPRRCCPTVVSWSSAASGPTARHWPPSSSSTRSRVPSPPAPALPEPRAAHAAVAVGDRLLVVGGTTRGGAAVRTTQVLDGTSWTDGPRLAVPRVKHAAVALADGRVARGRRLDDGRGTRAAPLDGDRHPALGGRGRGDASRARTSLPRSTSWTAPWWRSRTGASSSREGPGWRSSTLPTGR